MKIRWITPIWAMALIAGLVGCANLKEVREFAGESARLAAYTELTTRFRDTYQRESPYLTGETAKLAEANDKKRKAAYEDLAKVHDTVALYMKTLATLAGEDTFDLSKGIDAISGNIKAHPEFGIQVKHVDAATSVTKVVAKWISAGYQQAAVKEMIKEGNAPMQALLEGMAGLVEIYRKTHANEKASVLGLFEVELAFADSGKDRLLATLARVHAREKAAEYSAAEAKYTAAARGIRSIAEGHQRLFENVDRLSTDEVKELLKRATKDLKAVRAGLLALQG